MRWMSSNFREVFIECLVFKTSSETFEKGFVLWGLNQARHGCRGPTGSGPGCRWLLPAVNKHRPHRQRLRYKGVILLPFCCFLDWMSITANGTLKIFLLEWHVGQKCSVSCEAEPRVTRWLGWGLRGGAPCLEDPASDLPVLPLVSCSEGFCLWASVTSSEKWV